MDTTNPQHLQPTHPSILRVIHAPGSYASSACSTTSAAPGTLLARLAHPPLTFARKAYSTVQVSAIAHVELNCDFLYTNHSCEPSLEFHVVTETTEADGKDGMQVPVIEIRVAARRDQDGEIVGVREGDDLSFFYPSTEWEMAQPFECKCGARTCRGWVSGAREMGWSRLGGVFLNTHVKELLDGLRTGVEREG